MPERPYGVVLLGATGFTGQLVAERLARVGGLRWAIAGRDPHKIRDVKAGLVGLDLSAGDVGTFTADVRDPESLAEVARSARVLVTTVGPYLRHGAPVLEACVREGTHYLDLTGEPAFVSESRQRHDAAARDPRAAAQGRAARPGPQRRGARPLVLRAHHHRRGRATAGRHPCVRRRPRVH